MQGYNLVSITVGNEAHKAKPLTDSFTKYGHNWEILGEAEGDALPSKPCAFTWPFNRLVKFAIMEESHKSQLLPLIGVGKPWLGGTMEGPGGGTKVLYVRDFLNAREWADKDLILFSDGYDSNVCGTPEEFVGKWKLFQCDVIFGAESFNWPGQCREQPQLDSRFTFLNSGNYIGYAKTLKKMFNSCPIRDADDDQLYCQRLYVLKKWNIKLDTQKQIFCCLSDFRHKPNAVKNIGTAEREAYFCEETGTFALQLHGNGDHVIKSLWRRIAGLWINILTKWAALFYKRLE